MRAHWGIKGRRGMSLVEVLTAVVLLALASAGAVATWSVGVRADASKRVTEMGASVAVSELERLKTIKYQRLTAGTTYSAWYDRNGKWVASDTAPSPLPAQGFKSQTAVANYSAGADSGGYSLLQLTVDVYDAATVTKKYEEAKTLLIYGGI